MKSPSFEQQALHFHFALGPTNYVAGPGCDSRISDAFRLLTESVDPSGGSGRLGTKKGPVSGVEMDVRAEAISYGYCATAGAGWTQGTPQALIGAVTATVLGGIISISVGKVLS